MDTKIRFIRLDIDVVAVALEGAVKDWAAYIGTGTPERVAQRGTKLPYVVASVLFPDFNDDFTWRP
jgi:hypothetical protein